jgi:deazaflavin-dependent oxidoreductase (nitroreductase family)
VAQSYRLTLIRRLANAAIKPLIRLGLGGRHTYILTVRGRKTGQLHSTPVTLVEDGERWLVAPYGEVGWVQNARAAGEVTLSRAGRAETLRIDEVDPGEAAPVLREYVKRVSVARPYFDVTPDSPLEEVEAEGPPHPVFRLSEAQRG